MIQAGSKAESKILFCLLHIAFRWPLRILRWKVVLEHFGREISRVHGLREPSSFFLNPLFELVYTILLFTSVVSGTRWCRNTWCRACRRWNHSDKLEVVHGVTGVVAKEHCEWIWRRPPCPPPPVSTRCLACTPRTGAPGGRLATLSRTPRSPPLQIQCACCVS
jgi:hypothetical protein